MSQRNLFMISTSFYSNLHLQNLGQGRWDRLNKFIDLLTQTDVQCQDSPFVPCIEKSINIAFGLQEPWRYQRINISLSPHAGFELTLEKDSSSEVPLATIHQPRRTYVDKVKLFQSLVSGPKPFGAAFTLASPKRGAQILQHADWLRLSQLAEHMFGLLQHDTGWLNLHMLALTEELTLGENCLLVEHVINGWKIDGAWSRNSPPILDFACMPKEMNQVVLKLCNNNATSFWHRARSPALLDINYACQQRVKFAYAGNIHV